MRTSPGGDQRRPDPDVSAGLANVVTRRHGLRDRDRVAVDLDALDRNDRVGAVGHDRARRDLDRLAGTEAASVRACRRGAADDRERAGEVGGRGPRTRPSTSSRNGGTSTREAMASALTLPAARASGTRSAGSTSTRARIAGQGLVDGKEIAHESHATPGARGTLAS